MFQPVAAVQVVLAVLALKDMGFKDVAHVEEGFRGWKEGTISPVPSS